MIRIARTSVWSLSLARSNFCAARGTAAQRRSTWKISCEEHRAIRSVPDVGTDCLKKPCAALVGRGQRSARRLRARPPARVEVVLTVLALHRAVGKERADVAPLLDLRRADSRGWSAATTSPRRIRVRASARHRDVQQAAILLHVGAWVGDDALLHANRDRGLHGEPLGLGHAHEPHPGAVRLGAIYRQRRDLAEVAAEIDVRLDV